jgi:hypothetical protein
MHPRGKARSRVVKRDAEAVSEASLCRGTKRGPEISSQDALGIGDRRTSRRIKVSRDFPDSSEGTMAGNKLPDVRPASTTSTSKPKASATSAPPYSLDRSREAKYLQRGDGVKYIVGVDEAGRGEAAVDALSTFTKLYAYARVCNISLY